MLLKFIRKKMIEGLIKDTLKEFPKLKGYAMDYLAEHKGEIIDKILEAAKVIILQFIEKAKENKEEK